MDLRSYWLALRTGWLIVVAVTCACVVAMLALTWPSDPSYASTTRLFIAAGSGTSDIDELYERNAIAAQRLASYVELARSTSVASEVESTVGAEAESGSVTATAVPETVVISITATAPEAETARDIAAGYAEVLPEKLKDLETVRDVDGPQVRAVVIDQANLPTEPLPTSFMRDLIASVLLGLGVGMGVAVLRYALKNSDGGRPA